MRGFFALKEQRSTRASLSLLMKNVQMSSDWLRVALLLSEISHSMACSALYGKQILIFVNSHVYRYSQRTVKIQTILYSKI